MEQRTKTKITVLKKCNSHAGSVDHNDCLVGKYATGVKENVIIGTVYTDGNGLSNCVAPVQTFTWNRHTGPHAVAVPSRTLLLPKYAE